MVYSFHLSPFDLLIVFRIPYWEFNLKLGTKVIKRRGGLILVFYRINRNKRVTDCVPSGSYLNQINLTDWLLFVSPITYVRSRRNERPIWFISSLIVWSLFRVDVLLSSQTGHEETTDIGLKLRYNIKSATRPMTPMSFIIFYRKLKFFESKNTKSLT